MTALHRVFWGGLRQFSSHSPTTTKLIQNCPNYIDLNRDLLEVEPNSGRDIIDNMSVYNNFLNEAEENSILNEIESYMKQLKYEFDHWDDAIHGYRETERLHWNEANMAILDRVKKLAFNSHKTTPLKFVHVLDLEANGYIKPHIDAVRFCGDTIAGLSLLTDCVMRLVHKKRNTLIADVYLKRRSLYIMKGPVRYDYTHEILANQHSFYKGVKVEKHRRISVICRNEPNT